MKRIIFSIFALTLFQSGFSQPTQGLFGFKSGYVEYELTGNTAGKKYLWWDDYGAKTYIETVSTTLMEMFGVKHETSLHTILVVNGDNTWHADMITKKGTEDNMLGMLSAFNDFDKLSDSEKDALIFGKLKELGRTPLQTERFMGCDCQVFGWQGAKSWVCKGVVLKIEVESMGFTSNETAIKFETNIVVSSSKFDKVEGVNYSQNIFNLDHEEMELLKQLMKNDQKQ